MPRGGARNGKQGQAYGNRTDMNAQPVKVGPSQTYGQGVQQQQAQQAIPLPQMPTPGQPVPQMPQPGPLDAATNRPSEPVTSGIASGPGPGPEALGAEPDPVVGLLRGVYAQHPSPDILALLQEAQQKTRG